MNIPALNGYSFACNTAFEIISVLMFHDCIIYTKLHIFFTVSASNVTILPPLPVATVTTITAQSDTSSVPLWGKYKAVHLYVIYIFFSNFVAICISQRHEKNLQWFSYVYCGTLTAFISDTEICGNSSAIQ